MKTTTLGSSSFVRAAAVILAFALVPAFAAAQTAPSKRAQTRAAAAAPAPAPAPRAATSPYSFSLAIGPSFESPTAFKVRLEGAMTMKALFPNSTFELALPLAFAFSGESGSLGFGYSYDVSYFRFEIVPTARLGFPVARDFGLYADAGLGLTYYSVSVSTTAPIGFPASFGSSGLGGLFKIDGGGYYALDPHWRLFVEPVGLNFYFGEGSGFAYSIMFGATYRL